MDGRTEFSLLCLFRSFRVQYPLQKNHIIIDFENIYTTGIIGTRNGVKAEGRSGSQLSHVVPRVLRRHFSGMAGQWQGRAWQRWHGSSMMAAGSAQTPNDLGIALVADVEGDPGSVRVCG